MIEITGERFAGLLANKLKHPLFIKDNEEARTQQNVVLEIHCYDPDKSKEDEFLKATTDALKEEDLMKRVMLIEKVSKEMEQASHVSYKVGEITYETRPHISNIKVKSDYDGNREELVITDGESAEPLFALLEKMNKEHYDRLFK